MDHQIEVSPNGQTLWVNSGLDGSCIARFDKRFGMDIHRTGTEQMAGQGECLHCTHAPADEVDWHAFVTLVKHHYGVEIPIDAIRF